MPTKHIVQAGDSIIQLAGDHGLFADTLWQDPGNAELRKKRKDMNDLLPGDIVVIPDKRAKEVSKPATQRHRFKRKGIPAMFRFQAFDGETPWANAKFRLVVAGQTYEGVTNGQGILETHLPANAQTAELFMGEDEQPLLIQFGHMDPIEELVGVQKRLNNLGFDCGEPTGQMNSETRDALKAFQHRFGLKESGEADAATVDKLRAMHDTPESFPPPPRNSPGN